MNGPVTTFGSNKKEWAWSYSKLKNYEVCPKRHFHYDIAKDVKEPESEQLKDGNFIHEKLAERIGKNTPLPSQLVHLEPWADKILTGGGKVSVELKFAIARDFSPVSWFDKHAWYRGIADVLKLYGPVALAIDWKTGKIVEDSVQLALMAQCVFSHHPEVQKIRTEFVWLAEDATTRQDFARTDMPGFWAGIMQRVNQLEDANKTMTFPPKPGRLCKRWCAITACPYHGTSQ